VCRFDRHATETYPRHPGDAVGRPSPPAPNRERERHRDMNTLDTLDSDSLRSDIPDSDSAKR